jgi:hypothetical protein
VRVVLSLAVLFTSVVWADEASDRAAIEATISALNISSNNPQTKPEIFTADFPNTSELQRAREPRVTVSANLVSVPENGTKIETPAGILVISREPMGEATLYPYPAPNFSGSFTVSPRFKTRSVTFVSPNTAVVVAEYESFAAPNVPALFVLRKDGENWRIASFRSLPEAQTKVL